MIKLTLPWPPSVNRYWRSVNGRVLIAAAGRRYRTDVELVYRLQSLTGGGCGSLLVEVSIDAWLPDLRRRDIDNILKAPLDALTHAGLWDDDSQVVQLSIRKAGMDRERPRLEVRITEHSAAPGEYGDDKPGVSNNSVQPVSGEPPCGGQATGDISHRGSGQLFERENSVISRARAFSAGDQ